jgi:poly(beta-D-mannuronate) lyase
MLAEMGERIGIPLYQEQHGRLHLLVNRVLQGASHPEAFAQPAGASQTDTMPPRGGSALAWVEIWLARFPGLEFTRWVADRRPVIDPRMGGNMTRLYARQ